MSKRAEQSNCSSLLVQVHEKMITTPSFPPCPMVAQKKRRINSNRRALEDLVVQEAEFKERGEGKHNP